MTYEFDKEYTRLFYDDGLLWLNIIFEKWIVSEKNLWRHLRTVA